MKILAVDDDDLALDLLVAALHVRGHDDVTLARSGEEAMALVKAGLSFDCFLLDIEMPGMNGIELCQWIRMFPAHRAAPILMITGVSAKESVDKAFAAGATDYVNKPFDLTELGARLRIAERLCATNRKIAQDTLALRSINDQLSAQETANLADAFVLDEVHGVIDLLALENYLLQRGRGDLAGITIFTFNLDDIETLHRRCGGGGLYTDMLSDVAESFLTAMRGTRCFLSHAGFGTFAGVTADVAAPRFDEIEITCNQLIEGCALEDIRGVPMTPRVRIGPTHQLGLMQSGRGAVKVLRQAVADCQMPGVEPAAAVKWSPRGLLGAIRRAS